MAEENKGEKAEPFPAEMSDFRMTLKIWDVPPELGKSFIAKAKAKYGNKSWILLQDMWEKSNKFDELMSSGKILELETKLNGHESRIKLIESFILEFNNAVQEAAENGKKEEAVQVDPATEAAPEKKKDEVKTPKTFGRSD